MQGEIGTGGRQRVSTRVYVGSISVQSWVEGLSLALLRMSRNSAITYKKSPQVFFKPRGIFFKKRLYVLAF